MNPLCQVHHCSFSPFAHPKMFWPELLVPSYWRSAARCGGLQKHINGGLIIYPLALRRGATSFGPCPGNIL